MDVVAVICLGHDYAKNIFTTVVREFLHRSKKFHRSEDRPTPFS